MSEPNKHKIVHVDEAVEDCATIVENLLDLRWVYGQIHPKQEKMLDKAGVLF